jgi:Domain of unknown function (DUF1906)
MIAAPARPGRWLDTDVPMSGDVCDAVRASGYQGVFRYLPLPGNSPVHDISADELERIVAADLQCGLVQHCRRGPIDASHHDGRVDALCALAVAQVAGYPLGCHAFVDLEDLSHSTEQAVVVYENAWAQTWLDAQYATGDYVGFAVPLDAEALYHDLLGTCYWSDPGHHKVRTRGCAIVQGHEVTIQGVTFDEDYVAPDLLGGLPMVASPDPSTRDTDPVPPMLA